MSNCRAVVVDGGRKCKCFVFIETGLHLSHITKYQRLGLRWIKASWRRSTKRASTASGIRAYLEILKKLRELT